MVAKNFAVVLHPQALEFYPKSMAALWSRNSENTYYFLAKSIDQNGSYFFLELEQEVGGKIQTLQLHLQHAHVLYVLAGADTKTLGFTPA